MAEWVFGYGSLASPREAHAVSTLGTPVEADLMGFERRWDVAMWNPAPCNDTKYYVDPETEERPAIHVAFLNVVPAGGCVLNGVLIPVDHATVEAFDAREVNYRRIDVTDAIRSGPDGRVWTYVGNDDALERFRTGLSHGTAYISQQYFDYCRTAFEERGADHLERFEATTRPPECPLRSLILRRTRKLTGF